MYKFSIAIIFLIFTFSASAQFPVVNDLVILKNGKELRCKVLSRVNNDSLEFRMLGKQTTDYLKLSDISLIYLERWNSVGVLIGRRPMNYTFTDGATVGCDVLVLTNGSKIRGIIKEKPTEDSITIYVPLKERPVTVARESVVQRKSEISKRQPSEYQSWLSTDYLKFANAPQPKPIEKPIKSGMSYVGLSYNFLIPLRAILREPISAHSLRAIPTNPMNLHLRIAVFRWAWMERLCWIPRYILA